MKIIPRITELHSVGVNCGTNAAKVVLQYYGYDLTEALIFGLSSGLGFIHQYYSADDTYFVSGKNESLETNLCSLLGGTCISGYFDDEELAWQVAKQYVDNDMPVILDTSIRYLPYFEPYLESVSNIGFGLHNLVLAGYDEGEKTVLILDHKWNMSKIISMQELCRARNAKDNSMEPRNGYKVMIPSEYNQNDLKYEVEMAILLNINRMRYPFAYKMGLKGIKLFKKEILNMYEDLSKNSKYVDVCASLLEKLGTGGGNYRKIYGNFLKQAGEKYSNQEYTNLGNGYMQLGNRWKKLANTMLMKNPDDVCFMDELFDEIYDRENKLIDKLEEIILR